MYLSGVTRRRGSLSTVVLSMVIVVGDLKSFCFKFISHLDLDEHAEKSAQHASSRIEGTGLVNKRRLF